MSNTEKLGSYPSCKWPVKENKSMNPCGSTEKIFNVKGSGKYTGRPRETPICNKHLPDAIKHWNFDVAEPINK